jgi:hypothetical protein
VSLRIAFDLDGVVADFASAYREVEERLFGPEEVERDVPPPENEAGATPSTASGEAADAQNGERTAGISIAEKRARVWEVIESTPDFWLTLKAYEPEALRALNDLAARHRWDVFFVTTRPATLGETVQVQSQRWLAAQGFPFPSVLVLQGSRGRLASALKLHYLVDDLPRHCLDVIAESNSKPVLMVRDEDRVRIESGRRLRIPVVHSMAECLHMLEEAQLARSHPGVFGRISRFLKANRE